MSDDDFKVMPGPAPAPSRSALDWARQTGRLAGTAGHPPIPPPAFAMYAAAWSEGWLETAKPSGWRESRIDFNWKEER